MKIVLAIAAVTLITGCASRKPTPSVKTPATPPEFLMQIQQAGDQTLSCELIASQFRYGQVYIEAINRFFETTGPTAMASTAYTTTSGMATRYGNTTMGSATSATYGGGTVMVYPTLTIRAMDITRSAEKRQSELRRLAQRRGDCKLDDLQGSNKLLENQKRLLDGAQRHLDSSKAIMSSNERQAEAEKWAAKDLAKLKASNQEFIHKEQQKIDTQEARYKALLKEHQAIYERAEREAQSKRRWFDDNTKTVME